jgi:hypothetical protein
LLGHLCLVFGRVGVVCNDHCMYRVERGSNVVGVGSCRCGRGPSRDSRVGGWQTQTAPLLFYAAHKIRKHIIRNRVSQICHCQSNNAMERRRGEGKEWL